MASDEELSLVGNKNNNVSHNGSDGLTSETDQNNASKRQPTIFDAIKAGMLVPVQTFVETQGVQILTNRDEKGYYPAHWAALGGQTTILRYIIDNKGPVDEAADNELGQRPIHWACVNGHIAIVDILLQTGVQIDVVDNKGCTPLIVACQYGKTMLGGYLMGKGARMQCVDKDGDTALHWAAFKGHNELMRLLIYSGFNPHQHDNFGQTALHLSTICGNLTSVRELCELDKVEINIADKNGKTPLMLAQGRKHRNIIEYLRKESKSRNNILPKIDFAAIIFGPPGNTKGPLLFFLMSMLCWAYPMYIYRGLAETWYDFEHLHITFWMLNIVMWISLYHASTTDPGFIPRNIPEYDRAIKEVAHYDEWKQGKNPLARLCHTCRTVKPMRSKHCRVCGRCVQLMDHHCPYIYNCVGVKNRVWFFLFSTTVFFNGCITDHLCLVVLKRNGWEWLVGIGFLEAFCFTLIAALVFFFSIYHMLLNLSTNERINYKRYNYLKDGKGKYYNPYDRGYKINVLEFFHLRRAMTEDEVQFLNVTIV